MSEPRRYPTRTTSVIDEVNETPFSSSEEQDTELRLDEDALVDVEHTAPQGDVRPTSSITPPTAAEHHLLQTQLMSMMDMLTRTFAAQQASLQLPRSAAPISKEPKIKDPDTFDGSTKSLNGFLTECELVFELQPSRFGNDRTKINYMISLLRGTPLEAIRPYITSTIKPSFLLNFDEFILRLKLNYGDPDETGTARRKLKSLRQTTSASAYFAEFQQYIAVLQWVDGDMIVDRAIDGLKPNLKDEIARTGSNFVSLGDLMRFIIPLDNRLFRARTGKKTRDERRRQAKHHWDIQYCFGHTLRANCQDPYRRSDEPCSTSAKRAEVRAKTPRSAHAGGETIQARQWSLSLLWRQGPHRGELPPHEDEASTPDDNVKVEPKND